MFQTHTKKWLARKSQSCIAFSRVSGRYVKHFSDAKVQIFWLALSARSILFFSSFLFLMNKTISRVLRTQSWTYCTDKQWLISNVYIEPLFAENSRASGGSAPWAPGRGFAPGPHPYEARASRTHGALRARIFPPTPFFANPGSATVHIPPCSSKSLAPRGVDPGGAGEQSPPPPPNENIYFLGGGKHIVLPPQIISSTWKIDNM